MNLGAFQLEYFAINGLCEVVNQPANARSNVVASFPKAPGDS
jgi:hypothetical protein